MLVLLTPKEYELLKAKMENKEPIAIDKDGTATYITSIEKK